MIRSNSRDFRPRGRLVTMMLGASAARRLFGQGPAASQRMNDGVFENENVRAVRFRFQPHTVRPMHQVGPSLMVYLTDSAVRFTNADGQTWEEKVRAGEV